MENQRKFTVQLSFEEVKLPPLEDILILGKKCPQGKIAVSQSFELLVPNEFEVFEVADSNIEAVLINKKLLVKIDSESIINILKEKVFPFVSDSEILKIDFKLRIYYDVFDIEL